MPSLARRGEKADTFTALAWLYIEGRRKVRVMNFPSWLPEDVASLAEHALSIPDNDRAVIERLTTDDRMRAVWEKLSKEAPNAQSERVDTLIDYVIAALDYWETLDQNDLLLTRAEQGKRVSELIAAIDSFENLLDRNALLLVGYWTDHTNPINTELDRIRRNLNKYDLFWDELPPRINAEKAKRSFFMRELKSQLSEQYGKPLHSLIAVITSVVFDDDSVMEDDVRKA